MNHSGQTQSTTGDTIGGTLLVILSSISVNDVSKTMLLACIGAITSYLVSRLMRKLVS